MARGNTPGRIYTMKTATKNRRDTLANFACRTAQCLCCGAMLFQIAACAPQASAEAPQRAPHSVEHAVGGSAPGAKADVKKMSVPTKGRTAVEDEILRILAIQRAGLKPGAAPGVVRSHH